MTVKIDNTEPNVFPVIEKIDAKEAAGGHSEFTQPKPT